MAVQRRFLGWELGTLQRCVQELVNDTSLAAHSATGIDLSHLTVVLPNSRAERRLMELLIEYAEELGRPVLPPRRCTLGHVPELFYSPSLPLASVMLQQFAWAEGIRICPEEQLNILGPLQPMTERFLDRMLLGDRLRSLWASNLGPYGLSFQDIAAYYREQDQEREVERWLVLDELFSAYQEALLGYGAADREAERLSALNENRASYQGKLVLIGCVDIKPVTAQLLRNSGAEIHVFVAAPQSSAGAFDELGSLLHGEWQKPKYEVKDTQLRLAADPSGQAEQVVESLLEAGGSGFAPDQITLGVADPELIPFITRRFEHEGIPVRDAQGDAVSVSSPALLLRAVQHFLQDGSFSSLANLLRHPEFEEATRRRLNSEPDSPAPDLLTLLDRYYMKRLPTALSAGEEAPEIDALLEAVDSLLGPVHLKTLPCAEWAEPLLGLLAEVFGNTLVSSPHPEQRLTAEACLQLKDLLQEMAVLDLSTQEITAVDAIELLLRQTEQQRIPPPALTDELELLGWLELPLDDAPLMVVSGMNEGRVPGALDVDEFLPNAVRSALQLPDDAQRFARDAYILSALIGSGRRLFFTAGRRSAQGDPLLLSRLVLPEHYQALAERIIAFSEASETGRIAAGDGSPQFFLTPPKLKAPVTSMSVRSFADYLQCPYRFYLRHVLKLEPLSDSHREMDHAMFGSLAHDILFRFASKSENLANDDLREMKTILDALLNEAVQNSFGKAPLPVVSIQIEQLRTRLHTFAEWQQKHHAAGWRTAHLELKIEPEFSALPLPDGSSMIIGCRIDRIDYHPVNKEWVIIDYKAKEKAVAPDASHRHKKAWVDLQLPLYHYFAKKQLKSEDPIKLAYLCISSSGNFRLDCAKWSEEELSSAIELACEVAEKVHSGLFWPPAKSLKYASPYCQLISSVPWSEEPS